MAAAIYIFNLKKFEPLLRPAKLSASSAIWCSSSAVLRPGPAVAHLAPHGNVEPHSVLFEVSWCVMLYTTVLGIDIFIMALERWKSMSG